MKKNKDILLIHHRLPFPTHSGMDKARFSLIKLLNKKYNVTLLVLSKGISDQKDVDVVKTICTKLIIVNVSNPTIFNSFIFKKIRTLYYVIRSILIHEPFFVSSTYSRDLKKKVINIIKTTRFDIIQPLSDFSMDYATGFRSNALKFFGPNDDMVGMTDGIISVTKSWQERLFLKIDRRARMKWQEKMIKESDKICYFSKNDIENIISRNSSNKSKLIWMPGVIEYENTWSEQSLYSTEKNTLIFTGGLVSAFNLKSVIYFFKEIWPKILFEISEAKLYIVGQTKGDAFQKAFPQPNVIYTGTVDNMEPYLTRAAVFISPVICGTGIKTKNIEALRFGKPIVSTPEGISGLWELPDDIIKIKSDPSEFAKEVIKLLKNDEYRISTCLTSRKLFEEHYSFEKMEPVIYKIYNELLLDR